jgi:GTP-binding protein
MVALDQAAVSYQVVLTKADKLKPSEVARTTAETAATVARYPQVELELQIEQH